VRTHRRVCLYCTQCRPPAAAERILTADCNNDSFYTAPIIDIVQTHVVHYISLLAEIQQEEEIQWEK